LELPLGTARFVGELGSKALRMPQSACGALVGVPIESYLWAEADVHGVWSDAPKPRCHVPKRGRVGHQQLVAPTTHQPSQGYNHWNHALSDKETSTSCAEQYTTSTAHYSKSRTTIQYSKSWHSPHRAMQCSTSQSSNERS